MRSLTLGFLALVSVTAAPAMADDVFFDYSDSLGGGITDFLWRPLLKPAGVSSSINGQSGQWLAGIAPADGSSGSRFSGNANFPNETTDFLDGGGIYAFFSETHYRITTTSPETGLVSLILQIQIASDFLNGPSLTVTSASGAQTLLSNYNLIQSDEEAILGGFDTEVRVYGFQWDLSSIGSPITSYTVDWQVPMHTVLGGQQVQESTNVHHENVLQTVPEPASALALISGLGVLALRRRRRA